MGNFLLGLLAIPIGIVGIIIVLWLLFAFIGLLFHPLVWMIVAGIVIGGVILSALTRNY